MSAKVERLVNLTVALLETRRPLSLAELKRRTGYYTQTDAESARRMFERDKDQLRRLGVPIETRPVPHAEEPGYLVARDTYELPDVDLTADEVAALALAVRLTGAQGTPLALAKLAARAPDPAVAPRTAPTRIDLDADAVDGVAEAVVARIPLSFGYRTASGQTATRHVDPYGVVQRRSAWYLVGRDHDRDAMRAFRLDRTTGPPRPAGTAGSFEPPDDLDVAAAVSGPEHLGVEVRLAVAPTARWAAQVRGGRVLPTDDAAGHVAAGAAVPAGWDVVAFTGFQPVRDRSWVLGLGPAVRVLDPPELRSGVTDALERVLLAHEGDPQADPGTGDGAEHRAGDGAEHRAGDGTGT